MTKRCQVNIRLKPDELEALRALAAERNQTLTELLLSVLDETPTYEEAVKAQNIRMFCK